MTIIHQMNKIFSISILINWYEIHNINDHTILIESLSKITWKLENVLNVFIFGSINLQNDVIFSLVSNYVTSIFYKLLPAPLFVLV